MNEQEVREEVVYEERRRDARDRAVSEIVGAAEAYAERYNRVLGASRSPETMMVVFALVELTEAVRCALDELRDIRKNTTRAD